MSAAMRDERGPTPQSSHDMPGGPPIGSARQGIQHHAHAAHATQTGPPPTTLPSYHHLTSAQHQSSAAQPAPNNYLTRPGPGRPPDGLPFPSLPRLTSEATSATSTPSFPSPTAYSSSVDKTTQYAELSSILQKADPHIVRQAIRDNHERCLVGSDYHFSFLLNTVFHRADPATLRNAIRDFGERLVTLSPQSLLSYLKTEDFTEGSDMILSKVDSTFLDLALAKRLDTIRARLLVNALAKAGRLGYDSNDVVEERRDGTEHVIPHMKQDSGRQELRQMPVLQSQHPSQQPHRPPHHQASTAQQQQQQHPPPPLRIIQSVPPANLPQHQQPQHHQSHHQPSRRPSAFDTWDFKCSTCFRPCSGPHALRYHMFKKACNNLGRIERVGKDLCPHCGTEFTTQGGLLYHTKSQVCGEYTEKHVQAIMPALQEFYINRSRQISSLPPAAHEQPGFKSVNNRTYAARSPGITSPSSRPNDPYAVLSPEARQRFESEMRAAEEHYGSLMRRAMDLPQPDRDEELAKLKNSYNTKQSTTRKKYGIRLRERRTKAEIEAERTRLLAGDNNAEEPAVKRARSNTEGHPVPTQRRSSSPPRRQSAAGAETMTSTSTPSATLGSEAVKRQTLSPSTTPPRHEQPAEGSLPAPSTRSANSPSGEGDARAGSPMEVDEKFGETRQSGSDSDSDPDEDIPAKP